MPAADVGTTGFRVIEFVGPSGSGKTTLYRELLASRGPDARWRSFDEIRLDLARDLEHQARRQRRLGNLRQLLARMRPARGTSRSARAWANVVLAGFEKRAWQQALREGSAFEYAFNAWAASLSRDDRPALMKQRSIEFYYRVRLAEYVLLHYLDPPAVAVHDDGMFHNTPLDEGAVERLRRGDGVAPHAAITLHISDDENVRRRQARIDTGKPTYVERGLSPTQLRAACERSQLRAAAKRRLLDALEIPVLDIDAEGDPGDTLERCHAFIDEHVQGV